MVSVEVKASGVIVHGKIEGMLNPRDLKEKRVRVSPGTYLQIL